MSWKEGKVQRATAAKMKAVVPDGLSSHNAFQNPSSRCFVRPCQKFGDQTDLSFYRLIYQFFIFVSLIFFVFFLYWSFSSIIVKLSWLLFLYLKYIFNVNLLGSGWVLGPFEEWLSQHACHPLSFLKEVTRIYQRRRTSSTIVKYVFLVAHALFCTQGGTLWTPGNRGAAAEPEFCVADHAVLSLPCPSPSFLIAL